MLPLTAAHVPHFAQGFTVVVGFTVAVGFTVVVVAEELVGEIVDDAH